MISSLQDRFARKFLIAQSGCWEWNASVTNSGYGRIRFAGTHSKTLLAHRVSWEMANGTIPKGMQLCHKCDNRRCVNPDHLFLGTAKDNARDRNTKGRAADQRGEANGYSKLTSDLVQTIRSARKNGRSYKEITALTGVPKSTISNVLHHTWKHI